MATTDDQAWPGQHWGMPQSGPGSIGGLGRRIIGILVDWLASMLIAGGLLGADLGHGGVEALAPVGVLFVEHVVFVGALGYTPGHRIAGVFVASLGGHRVTLGQAVIRAALLCLFVPAILFDGDGRGLHDRAAGTLVVRR